MHASATIRAPDGTLHELVHGDVIGRVWSAGLQLNDGRVSEAHAMVSLREGELRLISLRGAFAVGGAPTGEVTLRAGLRVQLAAGLELQVRDVYLPEAVLGLEGGDLPRQALPGVCSILAEPRLRLARGYRAQALAHLWTTGDRWMIRQGEEEPRALLPGDTITLGDQQLRAVEIPLAHSGASATRRAGGVDAPLHLAARYDTVHLHRNGEVVAVLGGKQARLVSELVALDGPVSWELLSEQLWPGEPDERLRRQRLDVTISRLRRKLRAHGVRSDLVRMDGAGTVELFVYPHDTVEDRT